MYIVGESGNSNCLGQRISTVLRISTVEERCKRLGHLAAGSKFYCCGLHLVIVN